VSAIDRLVLKLINTRTKEPIMNVSRYIVRRTAYGFVTYDLDAKVNVGRKLRSRKPVQFRTDKLNGK
jgi:hypothetical protein